MREFHVLHLGAGVQSTSIYLMSRDGELTNEDGRAIEFDAAVFADTHDEEQETYQHLAWMKQQGGAPIVTVSAGSLSESLKRGVKSIYNSGMDWPMYVHGSCKPLDEAYLEDDHQDLFEMDCEGGCGL